MIELDDILRDSTEAIGPAYFRLPIAEAYPVLRERVYCYELYHQMRLRWPQNTHLVLSGEVDKRGHELIRRMGARAAAPDLLVHAPGNMLQNHAIIEVKSQQASPRGIEKDLITLTQFCRVVGYERAIYLFYGGVKLNVVKSIASRLEALCPIEIWSQEQQGISAQLCEVIE